MAEMKTPGVYVVEKSAFPNSIVEVATAVPAFIGYTEKASNNGISLANEPWPISSMSEFETYFGGPPTAVFEFVDTAAAIKIEQAEGDNVPASTVNAILGSTTFTDGKTSYKLQQSASRFLLYYSMQLFFQNGGGNCFIVSIGDYTKPVAKTDFIGGSDPLEIGAFKPLKKHEEPTMVVMPDTVLLSEADCISVQQQALMHCGETMQNRVAILDVWNGFSPIVGNATCVSNFRNNIGTSFLDFSMTYYPWLNTTIVGTSGLSLCNFSDKKILGDLVATDFPSEKDTPPAPPAVTAVLKSITTETDAKKQLILASTLNNISPTYKSIILEMATLLNILPPAAAMAGIYTMVDNTQGVWKAPANVSLNSVVSPTVKISAEQQQDLNVPICGKAVNAIRAFKGEGVMVWGARTLDGNSQDWRYINVRRTMLMIEQSVKDACQAYVFTANNAHTWLGIQTMISSFLSSIWSQGGLAGPSAADAFSVSVGLGKTMTAEDILNGILRVTVLVAVTHPAEFIQVTFEQEMQK